MLDDNKNKNKKEEFKIDVFGTKVKELTELTAEELKSRVAVEKVECVIDELREFKSIKPFKFISDAFPKEFLDGVPRMQFDYDTFKYSKGDAYVEVDFENLLLLEQQSSMSKFKREQVKYLLDGTYGVFADVDKSSKKKENLKLTNGKSFDEFLDDVILSINPLKELTKPTESDWITTQLNGQRRIFTDEVMKCINNYIENHNQEVMRAVSEEFKSTHKLSGWSIINKFTRFAEKMK